MEGARRRFSAQDRIACQSAKNKSQYIRRVSEAQSQVCLLQLQVARLEDLRTNQIQRLQNKTAKVMKKLSVRHSFTAKPLSVHYANPPQIVTTQTTASRVGSASIPLKNVGSGHICSKGL